MVLVGPDEKQFTIPKVLLTRRSAFFKAALEGGFKEAKEKMIRLPEADVAVFETWAQWAHTYEIVLIDPVNDMTGLKVFFILMKSQILSSYIASYALLMSPARLRDIR